ncbi:hypothetical protein H310_00384 [Aphanomyces invadans]|uniref:Uncharacterized protein n=1 Tax=Aphanomyces invadans TaxID=157072 RepID=A0A024UWF6_9STRA|nr:hypothetical protein H310_00384 [Aphanomyces invadans]ETW09968.1 hypothetical protein H310_00384 [Aphanomyces invadans]|eukprot:XP_008861379.1 hypothetical protein H310_00384 [Aphanomyces invadans]
MSALMLESLIGTYDQRNSSTWRREDIRHREQECQWRTDDLQREQEWRGQDIRRIKIQAKLENERRQADTRSEQLSAVSSLGALLGGFALISVINVSLPDPINLDLLWVYGITSALCICTMVVSSVTFTVLLVAVTRYSAHELEYDVRALQDQDIDFESPFYTWWLKKCETDWLLGYLLFRAGVTLFLIELGIVSWVQYSRWEATSISISVVAGIGLLIWQFRILSKWRYLMKAPPVKVSGVAREIVTPPTT